MALTYKEALEEIEALEEQVAELEEEKVHHQESISDLIATMRELKELKENYAELESVSQYNIEVDNLYDQLKMEELKRLFECCDLETLELM